MNQHEGGHDDEAEAPTAPPPSARSPRLLKTSLVQAALSGPRGLTSHPHSLTNSLSYTSMYLTFYNQRIYNCPKIIYYSILN